MKKALIELKGISKNFAGVKALQNVDLTITKEKPVAWPVKMAAVNQLLLRLSQVSTCQMAEPSGLMEKNFPD